MHGGMKGAANEKERLGDIRRRVLRRLHGRVCGRMALVLVGQLTMAEMVRTSHDPRAPLNRPSRPPAIAPYDATL